MESPFRRAFQASGRGTVAFVLMQGFMVKPVSCPWTYPVLSEQDRDGFAADVLPYSSRLLFLFAYLTSFHIFRKPVYFQRVFANQELWSGSKPEVSRLSKRPVLQSPL